MRTPLVPVHSMQKPHSDHACSCGNDTHAVAIGGDGEDTGVD